MQTFKMTGQLTDLAGKKLPLNTRIEVWDKDVKIPDKIGESTIGASGKFEITFLESDFKDHPADHAPDVYFKVYHGPRLLKSTEKEPLKNFSDFETNIAVAFNSNERLQPLPSKMVHQKTDTLSKQTAVDTTAIIELLNEALSSYILERIPLANERAREVFSMQQMDYTAVKDYTVKQLVAEQTEKIIAETPELQEVLADISERFDEQTTVSDALHLDVAVNKNPLLKAVNSKSATYNIAKTAKLTDEKAMKLSDLVLLNNGNVEQALSEARTQKLLTATNEKIVRIGLYSQQMLSPDEVLTTNIQLNKLVVSGATKSKPLVGLIKLDESGWDQLLKEDTSWKERHPSMEAYKQDLQARVATYYPSDVFLFQVTQMDKTTIGKQLTSTKALLKDEHVNFSDWRQGTPDATSFQKTEQEAQANWKALQAMANSYAYLGLAAVLDDASLSEAKKTAAITSAGQVMDKFYQNNPELDFRSVDFVKGEQYIGSEIKPIDWSSAADEDQNSLRNQLMAYQRIFHVTDRPEASMQLIRSGYFSAQDLSGVSDATLITQTGLSTDQVSEIRNQATAITQEIALRYANLWEQRHTGPMLGNAHLQMSYKTGSPEELDGYEAHFGSQKYCACDHCQSLYSPAAYFVDLMKFSDQYISSVVFGDQPEHIAHLKNRRPDLWELSINCDNTHDLVANLQISNAVLESYIASKTGQDPYELLRTTSDSLRQPFHLDHTELLAWLDLVQVPVEEVVAAGPHDEERYARAILGMSKEVYELIVDPLGRETSTLTEVSRWLGVEDIVAIELQQLLKQTGLERDQLEKLLASPFFQEKGIATIRLAQEPGDQLNQFTEYLDTSALTSRDRTVFFDRLHRLLRLQPFTTFSLEELSFLLQAFNQWQGTQQIINADAVRWVSTFEQLRKWWEFHPEVLAAFWGVIAEWPSAVGRTSLFDQLWNQQLAEDQVAWKMDDLPVFQHDFFNTNLGINESFQRDPNTDRLLAALGVVESELLTLLRHLREAIDIDLKGQFALKAHFATLYQHVAVSRLLEVDIDQLFYLISLSGNTAAYFNTPDAIVDFLKWSRALNISYEDIGLLAGFGDWETTPKDDLVSLFEALEKGVMIPVEELQALLPERGQFEEWIADATNKGLMREVKGLGYHLTEKYDPATADIDRTIAEKLNKYLPVQQLSKVMKDVFNLSEAHFEGFVKAERIDLGDGKLVADLLTLWALTEKGELTPGERLKLPGSKVAVEAGEQLIKLLRHSQRKLIAPTAVWVSVAVIQEAGMLTEAESTFLTTYFGVEQLTAETLAIIDRYLWLLPQNDTDLQADFHALLSADFERALNDEDFFIAVAELFGLDPAALQPVIELTAFEGDPLPFLVSVIKRALLSEQLGVTVETLFSLGSEDAATLKQALEALLIGIKNGYSASQWSEHQTKVTNRLLELKRDALTDFLITNDDEDLGSHFNNLADLYEYFLIDSEMQSCGETSYILSVISSLQLYIQRSLTNAEAVFFAGLAGNGQTPDFTAIDYDQINLEWEWRRNYRVWEANRKVFLYPENYLEPGLRDNKSPEFVQLEEALLQRSMNTAAAEEIFRKYFEDVHGLSKLKIDGNYFDDESNTLYLVGRTVDHPIQYYIRRYIDQKEWSSWEKVEVPIESDQVSPIVIKGKLHLFWIQEGDGRNTKTITNSIQTSDQQYIEYDLCYIYQKQPDQWSATERINLVKVPDTNSNQKKSFSKKLFMQATDSAIHVIYDSVFEPISIIQQHVAQYYSFNRVRKRIDFFNKTLHAVNFYDDRFYPIQVERTLVGLEQGTGTIEGGELQAILVNDQVDDTILYDLADGGINNRPVTEPIGLPVKQVAIDVVYNKPGDTILKENRQYFYLKSRANADLALEIGNNVFPEDRKLIATTMSLLSTTAITRLDERLYLGGLEEFFSLSAQQTEEDQSVIKPLSDHTFPYAISFTTDRKINFEGVYGNYYREMFFHIPYTMANHFNANGQYKEAQQWYHYIFNPMSLTEEEGVSAHWRYLPFRDKASETFADIFDNDEAISRYRNDPFNPHAIARLRENAYKKAVLMKYVDNLLDWGDQLFTRDSRESINEALMTYLLAADILGDKPQALGSCDDIGGETEDITYQDILDHQLNDNEFLYQLENVFGGNVSAGGASQQGAPDLQAILLFCIPNNGDLLKYWDRLADRLYKIRHCQNIKGLTRQLPLLEPAIDPLLLVRARAAGLDISSVVNGSEHLVNYRFQYLLEKAKSYVGEVRQLGAALLSALEKKDQEELQQLRATHEQNILRLSSQIRNQEIAEAQQQLEILQSNRKTLEARHKWFAERIEKGLNVFETSQQVAHTIAIDRHEAAGMANWIASTLYQIPQFTAGLPPESTFGGVQLGGQARALGEQFSSHSSRLSMRSSAHGIAASHQRRREEWEYQRDTAEKELEAMDQQILAAEIRLNISELALANHETQVAQSQGLFDFYQGKFSNLNLYDWMSRQLKGMYMSTYELARKMANRALAAFKHQYDADFTLFIGNEHWNGQYQGLLAGEQLMQDLQQLETAYVDYQVPAMEIRQSFSLAQLSPAELLRLRETGACHFDIPAYAFDLVYPGHQDRKIKSVSMTIPAVTGPYVNVGCELSLIPKANEMPVGGDAIAVSHGVNDHGKFELNFNGERLMPFEGVDAVSNWHIKLPNHLRTFNYDTIGDVILHISYCARQGSVADRENVELALKQELLTHLQGIPLGKVISMKTEMPAQYHQVQQGLVSSQAASVLLDIKQAHFPHFLSEQQLSLNNIYVMMSIGEALVPAVLCDVKRVGDTAGQKLLKATDDSLPYPHALFDFATQAEQVRGEWQLSVALDTDELDQSVLTAEGTLDLSLIDDILLGFNYGFELP